jgi:acyl carrier protein phosphodiesterase
MLTQKFYEYKQCLQETLWLNHIVKMKNMATQLTNIGETVTNVTIIAKILASLSSKYSTLQTAWDSVDPER